ncbi:MAG: hypothetical protein WCR02_08450 [Sphaerochaetaceae bacterium]
MKKILALLLVFSLSCSFLFAEQFISIGFGPSALYNVSSSNSLDDLKKVSNYDFGAEMRVKIMLVNFTTAVLLNPRVDNDYEVSVLVTAGLAFDFGKCVRLGLGIGPRFKAVMDQEGKAWVVNSENALVLADNLMDILRNSPVSYRASLDYLVGKVSFGFTYQVDSQFRFRSWEDIRDLADLDWSTGKVGMTVLFSLR